MLAVKNLEVVYQDVILVLRGISFEIPKGKIVALLGSNGSGKTTVIRSITGLLDVQNGDITKGNISVDGDDITNLNPSKIILLEMSEIALYKIEKELQSFVNNSTIIEAYLGDACDKNLLRYIYKKKYPC